MALEECFDKCTAKQFTESFIVQYRCMESAIEFDSGTIKSFLSTEPDSRRKSVLLFLLDRLQQKRNKFREDFKILNKRDSRFLSFQ